MTMCLPLMEVAKVLGCTLAETDAVITGAAIDSRKIAPGHLFVALAGEHVDGHDYLEQARAAGASAALVAKTQDDPLPQLQVDDVVAAFGELAHYWRRQCPTRIVAVTGSNGKTTVKEMVAAILRQVGRVISTHGNLNNELGVPLTLCRLSKEDDFAVVEMGANHAGEISQLAAMTLPDVAVINNVAAAHLEGFGSLEGVARAKGEIFSALQQDGIGVVNVDMPYTDLWQHLLGDHEKVSFALEHHAEVNAVDINLDAASSHFMVQLDDISHFINLPVPGKHNVANALAAIAACRALNIEPEAMVMGLSGFSGVARRQQFRAGPQQSRLIDDTYNANPESYQQALQTLMGFSGQHWVVLGDFAELGENETEIHRALGEQTRQAGIDKLWAVGKNSRLAVEKFGEGARHFNDINALSRELKKELTVDVTCLIKGSRSMQMDRLADALAEVENN